MPGSANAPQSNYILGWSDAEQDRLIRQATLLAPMTERLFREAGIGEGQRVLDIGSGVGDVAMIAARLVGPSGEVVGIERNADYIARARERISALGLRNVTFIRADLNDVAVTERFDAAVGRLILTFFPDPVAVLRSVSRLLLPRGVIAMIEPCWSATLAMNASVPLVARLVTKTHELFTRLGIDTERVSISIGSFRMPGWTLPTCISTWTWDTTGSLPSFRRNCYARCRPTRSDTACRWRSSATSTHFPIVSTPSFSRRTHRSRMSRW